ncbi:MAG TPA: Zn-dependent alcohol dehydrogenase [Methylomirabilota bacterium]|jgi:Zn-dependent alcohol dehydrogenase|nr:Zn-dependent alcohol dehydrogenase [Methylomirabilota bacterium]
MRARAAVLYELKQPLVVEDVDVLEPGPHEVLVRYVASGICHSDLHVITGDLPHPLPVVLGHEGAGVVEKVGPGVEWVRPGDHVVTSYIPSCGTCRYCIVGRPNLCALRDKPRHLMLDGTSRFRKGSQALNHFLQVSSYATHAVLLEHGVIPIRRDAPLDVVCLVSCAVTAGAGAVMNRARVPAGSTVAVFGCGGVGLNVIQAARLMGAAKIIAVDVLPQKLAWAEEFGATHRVDAAREDPVARIHELAGHGGADFAFEVVGTQRTIEQAFHAVHRGGMAVVIGLSPAGTRLSIDPGMLLQERVLTGSSFGGSRQKVDLPLLIDLFMDGRLKVRELISRRLPLEEINHAFDLLQQGEVKRSVIVYQ